MVNVGIFEVDPELIPEAPRVPLGEPLVFEIAPGAKLGEVTNENGHTRWVDFRAIAVDVEHTPAVFPRLFVTERFMGSPARSWKNFLRTCSLPYTTDPGNGDLDGFRFKGTARKSKRDDGAAELASVAGPA